MPYFIATVFWANHDAEEAQEADGPQAGRTIVRTWANTEAEFRQRVLDERADDEVSLGPVSLSKRQEP